MTLFCFLFRRTFFTSLNGKGSWMNGLTGLKKYLQNSYILCCPWVDVTTVCLTNLLSYEYLTLPVTSITFYICMKYGFNSTPGFHTAQEVLLATIEAEWWNWVRKNWYFIWLKVSGRQVCRTVCSSTSACEQNVRMSPIRPTVDVCRPEWCSVGEINAKIHQACESTR